MTAGISLNLRIAYMCYDARSGPIQKVSEIHPSLPTVYYLFFRKKIDINPTSNVRFWPKAASFPEYYQDEIMAALPQKRPFSVLRFVCR
jgi:hypothetical protein